MRNPVILPRLCGILLIPPIRLPKMVQASERKTRMINSGICQPYRLTKNSCTVPRNASKSHTMSKKRIKKAVKRKTPNPIFLADSWVTGHIPYEQLPSYLQRLLATTKLGHGMGHRSVLPQANHCPRILPRELTSGTNKSGQNFGRSWNDTKFSSSFLS